MNDSARTSYDIVHYPSKAYAYTHPDRLGTLARLFGLRPTPPERARILELGCGEGGNILPIAARLPGSEVVGLDLSREAIGIGQRKIDSLGLTNIELRVADIMALPEDLGRFDYILCHGVYSWIPEEVAEALMAGCKALLAPTGVAYISYNTYPGWHLHNITREIMRVHASQFTEPMEQVQQGQALVRFLAQSLEGDNSPYSKQLQRAVKMMDRFSPEYFFHDFLSPVNRPMMFRDFVAHGEAHQLQYLGDAMFGEMMPTNLPGAIRGMLDRVAPDLIHLEQYMDLVRGTAFRRSLLCHQGHQLKRNLSGEDLKGLYVLGNCSVKGDETVDLLTDEVATFVSDSDETEIRLGDRLGKSALAVLMKAHPQEVAFEDLCVEAARVAQVDVDPKELLVSLGGVIIHAYGAGVVDLVPRRRQAIGEVSACPEGDSYARAVCEADVELIPNIRHEMVKVTRFDRVLLTLLDGQRDESALIEALCEAVHDGRLTVKVDEVERTEPEVVKEAMTAAVPVRLARLLTVGLLVG